jgi:hypothetical protein
MSNPVCSQCARPLDRHNPSFGVPYWACPTRHDPPEVASIDRDLDYAIALVRTRIVDPLDGMELHAFDADHQLYPADFLNAVSQRLDTCLAAARERERIHHLQHRDTQQADHEQASIATFD